MAHMEKGSDKAGGSVLALRSIGWHQALPGESQHKGAHGFPRIMA